MKRAISLLLLICVLASAASLAEIALPEPEPLPREMLLGEVTAEYFHEATLCYIGVDGVTLSQVSRTLLIHPGESLAEAVLEALFNPSGSAAQASVVPGDTKLLSLELSGGIATVNLSIEARGVQDDQELFMMCSAIAATLCDIEGIGGVNILINGRQEGVLQLPLGVLGTPGDNLAAAWAQLKAESDRYLGSSGGSVARTATLYFPSKDGNWLLPEARTLNFTRGECAPSLLAALGAGPSALSCALAPFAGGALLGEPTLTVTATGERVLELNLRNDAVEAAERAGAKRWQLFGSIALSLCSFVPELDAVRLSVDGVPATGVAHPTAPFAFEEGLIRRRDFSGRIGGAAELYLADERGNLILRQRALSRGAALSPRALLEALLSEEIAAELGAFAPTPAGLGGTDILGLRVSGGVATVNLSARFYGACQALDERRERTAVYAIVNTLCQLAGVGGVRFLIEGESVESLSQEIYLRSTLLPNPGIALRG